MANVNGTNGRDFIHSTGDGRIVPPGFNDIVDVTNGADTINGDAGDDRIYAGRGDDIINGGTGDDVIVGESGNDVVRKNVGTAGIGDGSDRINLSMGSDVVEVNAPVSTNVRLTFTSAEVGNGLATDSAMLANQDGGLAVRLQAEVLGTPAGQLSRVDDEGITFVGGAGVTFDVRDLVSGAARGENFEVVTLGTNVRDVLPAIDSVRPYYINGGQGNDAIGGGDANDFLVGGAGDDNLAGKMGNDTLLGGVGDDVFTGWTGDDIAIINASTDGRDRVNLGDGNDLVNVSADGPGQIRLTFTSAEVGNGMASDSDTMSGQDGFLAVRMRLENAQGSATGDQSRVDDEGITFSSTTAGLTFDVRDLVSGVARGDQFEVVTLGTKSSEMLTAVQSTRAYYINAGQGNDTVTGGTGKDFLVGGGGNDTLDGGLETDSLLGGAGQDKFLFSTALGPANRDTIVDFNVVDDTIVLDSSVFVGLMSGMLSADEFVIGTAASDASDRIVYDNINGRLLFDRDGSGTDFAAVQFAGISTSLAMTNADFTIV